MIPGRKYRITYKSDLQRIKREAVMVYLGDDERSYSFSARPKAGTQEIPKSWVIDTIEVDASTVVYLNRKV